MQQNRTANGSAYDAADDAHTYWHPIRRDALAMKLLVIEDEAVLRRVIADHMAKVGIEVMAVSDAAAGLAALKAGQFDVVILDLTLQDSSGLDVLRELRQSDSSAHVMVVSGATSVNDRIRALCLGADDYVTKPFFASELAARALAVRRRLVQNAKLQRDKSLLLRFDGLEIDLVARKVSVWGAPAELTTKEFELLAYLAARPGRVFSREELLQSVWHSASAWQRPATVTEHVRRLRAKLGEGTSPRLLVSIRGVGYRFDPPAASHRAA
jgi:DNA-binding response OmpR family regulator